MSAQRRAAAALLSVGLVMPSAAAYARDSVDTDTAVVAAQSAARPQVAPAPSPVLTSVSRGALPSADGVQAALADELADKWLGDDAHVGVTVRDVASGEHLLDHNDDRALVPASTTKLLAAAAIVSTLPMNEPFRTRATTGPGANEIVLVAGGDMMLASGAGDPEAVEGRAGLADLADQTAAALKDQDLGTEATPARLRLDTTYAAGASRPKGWTDYWLAEGFTGPITMLALVEHRAVPYHPAPKDPAESTARVFRTLLKERGIAVTGGPDTTVERVTVPADAQILGEVESAPARDVLAEALASSDNAMVEQLARQAAVADGTDPAPAAVRDWVVGQVSDYGVDVTGVKLADVSGLSDGTRIPARVLGDLLVVGADGSRPELQGVLGELPIAGYSGTLWDRFALERQRPAVGVARAKTGSLPGVTSLAGLVVTRDGRLVAYVMLADEVGRDGAGLEARSVLDSMVAELASCGCQSPPR